MRLCIQTTLGKVPALDSLMRACMQLQQWVSQVKRTFVPSAHAWIMRGHVMVRRLSNKVACVFAILLPKKEIVGVHAALAGNLTPATDFESKLNVGWHASSSLY